MKLGVYNAILHDRPLPEALKVIAGLGLTGIEINTGGFLPAVHVPNMDQILESDAARDDYLALFEGTGVSIAGLKDPGTNFDEGGPAAFFQQQRAASSPALVALATGELGPRPVFEAVPVYIGRAPGWSGAARQALTAGPAEAREAAAPGRKTRTIAQPNPHKPLALTSSSSAKGKAVKSKTRAKKAQAAKPAASKKQTKKPAATKGKKKSGAKAVQKPKSAPKPQASVKTSKVR